MISNTTTTTSSTHHTAGADEVNTRGQSKSTVYTDTNATTKVQTVKHLADFILAEINGNSHQIPAPLSWSMVTDVWEQKWNKTEDAVADNTGFRGFRHLLTSLLLIIYIAQLALHHLQNVVMSQIASRVLYAKLMLQTHVTLSLEPYPFISGPKSHIFESSNSSGDDATGKMRLRTDFIKRIFPRTDHSDEMVSAEVTSAVRGGLVSTVNTIAINWTAAAATAEEDDDDESKPSPKTLIFKTIPATVSFRSVSLLQGQNRESKFYNWTGKSPLLQHLCPTVYHSEHSDISGDFVIVMEDLSGRSVSVSKLLGNQCWGPCTDIPAKYSQADQQLLVLDTIMRSAADIHASHWRDRSLLSQPWLKYSDHLVGRGRARYEYGLIAIRASWEKIKMLSTTESRELITTSNGASAAATGVGTGLFSPLMLRTMETALKNSSWYAFRQTFDIEREDVPFTLVHGDFHGANMLWRDDTSDGKSSLVLLDWSEAGIFCPFTEISQLMISNARIDFRRKYERRLFDLYYDRLISQGVDATVFSREMCWERYVLGGIEKWLQFVVILATISLSNPSHLPWSAICWFHDQVEAFVEDHLDGVSQPLRLMTSFPMANQFL